MSVFLRSDHLALRTTVLVLLACCIRLPGAETPGPVDPIDPAPVELPCWPHGIDLPVALKPTPKPDKGKPKPPQASILAWVPEGATRIRAALLIPANSDSKHFGEHTALRAVLAKHAVGIVYLRAHSLEDHLDDAQAIMDAVAEDTGIVEFRHCPWITFGKSSRGRFPFTLAWKYPHRVLASISYHAETPTWPMQDWVQRDEMETLLHCHLNGETEWGATFAVHVRPSLLNYRIYTPWLVHQAIAEGIDHGNYPDAHGSDGWGKAFPDQVTCLEVWDYLSVFTDKALTLRLPKDVWPSDGPLELLTVDPTQGLLLEPFALEDVLQQPRLPLIFKDGAYVINAPPEASTNGYAVVAPAEDFKVAPGVPVVTAGGEDSPTDWLLVKGLNFSLKTDPQEDVSVYVALRPRPGDPVTIEGEERTWTMIGENEVGKRQGVARGIAMKPLGFKGKDLSLLAYTVLQVETAGAFKVVVGHSMAVRAQGILNGTPVDNQQIVELSPGSYPFLVVVRMKGVTWDEVEPKLVPATTAEVEEAKTTQEAKALRQAELEKRLALERDPLSFFRPYNEVPEEGRAHMMWIADQELAAAWVKLHDPAKR